MIVYPKGEEMVFEEGSGFESTTRLPLLKTAILGNAIASSQEARWPQTGLTLQLPNQQLPALDEFTPALENFTAQYNAFSLIFEIVYYTSCEQGFNIEPEKDSYVINVELSVKNGAMSNLTWDRISDRGVKVRWIGAEPTTYKFKRSVHLISEAGWANSGVISFYMPIQIANAATRFVVFGYGIDNPSKSYGQMKLIDGVTLNSNYPVPQHFNQMLDTGCMTPTLLAYSNSQDMVTLKEEMSDLSSTSRSRFVSR